jgi:hypothetical protein
MNHYFLRFTLMLWVAVSIVLTETLPASGAFVYQKSRIVARRPWPNEPVKVVGLKTKNKSEVEIGKSFEEEDDWLDGLALTISNGHDKTVTALNISLVFRREPGDTRPPFGHSLRYGPSPLSADYVYRDPNKVIKPGETLELRITPEDYQSIQHALAQTGYTSSVIRVEVEVKEVGFEDGSMLYSGTLYVQDPDYPNDPTKKVTFPRRVSGP